MMRAAAAGVVPAAATTSYALSDAELALRMEQEERDAELAREWIAQEQMRSSAARAQAAQQQQKSCCSCRRLMSCCLSLTIVLGATAAALYFFVFSKGEDNWWNNPGIFGGEDPFNNANPEDANLWNTGNKSGLRLTIVSALDSVWVPFFNTAVQQWDSGIPDALELSIRTDNPQSVCDANRGVIKVCNGNYGATNWRGINKVLLENGWIYASAARMNDYYFGGSGDDAQRQYTMCHEIGHGFGLPHTDENFNNRNLGNCKLCVVSPSGCRSAM